MRFWLGGKADRTKKKRDQIKLNVYDSSFESA
jgi:hypothetical protein